MPRTKSAGKSRDDLASMLRSIEQLHAEAKARDYPVLAHVLAMAGLEARKLMRSGQDRE